MENREVKAKKTFNESLGTLWQAFSNKDHLEHWWGPAGFKAEIHRMDFVEGGDWNLTLTGPDGARFPNRSIFKEIVPLEKIVFEHFNPHFITTLYFKTEGTGSSLDWTLLFDTPEMRDIVVKAHKAEEGQKENMEKLEAYLMQNTIER